MADINMVIACLQYCGGDSVYCKLCPYDNHAFCKYSLMRDAAEFLKKYREHLENDIGKLKEDIIAKQNEMNLNEQQSIIPKQLEREHGN